MNKLEYASWLAEMRAKNKARPVAQEQPSPAPGRMSAEEIIRCYNQFVLGVEEDPDEDEDDIARNKKKKQPADQQPEDEDEVGDTTANAGAKAIIAAYRKCLSNK